ncbi:hypothetical protein T440DRAFT_509742 [Plenodomus tracheiphilus IPT5]|uniref:Uncharacterized protein n=1 Tax=Plenodomus tracheiphilus IPT5 TaxID=1408161 RepID=A0A6A7B1G5_9PLEO|nr:hypothetical protein T440DRAFT_509742 [Plenodomus tracheiphilus IPT5]
MSFDLEALFCERMEVFAEPPRPVKVQQADSQDASEHPMPGSDGLQQNTIQALIQERDSWKTQAHDLAAKNETLEKRIHSKRIARSDFSDDAICRAERLQHDNTRLRAEVLHLKESLKAAESENTTLCDDNDGKTRKLKGANKKFKNAKDAAGKEEEKAKGAVSDKQRHLASERKMKKERNDALAALQEQTKINEDLRAELTIEKSDTPHLRDTATDPNNTIVVIPIEFEIRRIDFTKLLPSLHANQVAYRVNSRLWYKEWKKPQEEVRQVVGADYVDDERDKKKMNDKKIYEDLIEMPKGYIETAAEHDGRRSKRGLEAICRRSEDTHDGGCG